MRWVGNFQIHGHDMDFQGVAKASSVVEYMQEAARKHVDICPSVLKSIKENNAVFVLSRLVLSNYKSLRADDELIVETWAAKSHGVSYPRYTKMYMEGRLTAEMAAIWTTINAETRRIVRMGDVMDTIAISDELSMDIPARLRIPQNLTMYLMGEYRVNYSVCDSNKHMNNVRYVDMFSDYIGEDLKNKRITNVDITYVSEAAMGETLRIYSSKDVDDGRYYLRAVRSDDKVCAEAQIITDFI